LCGLPAREGFLFAHLRFCPRLSQRWGWEQGQKDKIMRSKKETSGLLPGIRRLLASMLQDAAALANAHPMVIATTPAGEKYDPRGVCTTRD